MKNRLLKKSMISGVVSSTLIFSLATPAAFANEDESEQADKIFVSTFDQEPMEESTVNEAKSKTQSHLMRT